MPANRKRSLSKKQGLVVALVTVLVTAIGTITITGRGGGSIRVEFGGPHGTPERAVTVPEQAAEQAAASELADHDRLRSENPPGVTPAQLDAGREQQEQLAQNDQLPIVTPNAAPQQRGCLTRLVGNYSSRRGVRPRLFVLHYTVSPNRPGWSDVWAVAGLFDRPSFAASSHYIVDAEGHCAYIVRESDKSWTQAAANPVAISVEIINSGREPSLAGRAGLAKVALIAADAARRWEIPLQRGAVRGCTVARPGIVQHRDLGPCGGGHVDISPYPIDPVIAAARKAAGVPPTKPKRRRGPQLAPCTVRNLQRRLGVTADGIVGPQTRTAIRALQRRHKFTPTGRAGVRVGRVLRLAGCRI